MNFIEIYVPITKDTFLNIISGNVESVFNDSYSEGVLSLLKNNKINGNFGNYEEVLEISLGIETYKPSKFSAVHNIKVTAYIDNNIDKTEIINLIEKLINIHPWEHPVLVVWIDNFRLLSNKKPLDFILELKKLLYV